MKTIDNAIARELAPKGILRAALNMGNPILTSSMSTEASPAGISIDLARELAVQAHIDVSFSQHQTAAAALAAVLCGEADIGFMAIDPERSHGIHFTDPYVEIIGSYAVPSHSKIKKNDEVDTLGQAVVVGEASAYDLFLSRNLTEAKLVRVPLSERVIDEMFAGEYAACAGIRQQLQAEMSRFNNVRLLDGGFMTIRQAAIVSAQRSSGARETLNEFIEWALESGFVEQAIKRHGVEGVQVARKG